MTATIRIGILHDICAGPPSPSDIGEWIEGEIDAVTSAGRLSAPVEIVESFGLGLPMGSADAVERAYEELAAAGVVLVVGPAIGDNALVATPFAERHRLPTLNWAGAERARGEWMFHLQVGSHEDESLVIARHLARAGARRIAVAYDQSPIGTRHLEFLREEAALLGQEIVSAADLDPMSEDAESEVAGLLAEAPDALVYLGLGISAAAVARAAASRGFSGPKIMNTAGIRGYQREFAEAIDGWTYIDMFSDANRTLQELLRARGLPPEKSLAAAKGYDIGRLVAEALARAPELTREGVKLGLERIKWLPAAEGEGGTVLGFGVQDRGALHGRYLVVRQWRDGKTVEV